MFIVKKQTRLLQDLLKNYFFQGFIKNRLNKLKGTDLKGSFKY